METFRINIIRILSYLLYPAIYLLFFVAISYYITPDLSIFRMRLWITIWSIFFFLISLGPVLLLINHYKHFKDFILEYDSLNEKLWLNTPSSYIYFNKNDILEIKELCAKTGRIPWEDIRIWEITLPDQMITLAPILISGRKFKKIFSGLNIQKKHTFFVSVKSTK